MAIGELLKAGLIGRDYMPLLPRQADLQLAR
jgi:hypothetical protein